MGSRWSTLPKMTIECGAQILTNLGYVEGGLHYSITMYLFMDRIRVQPQETIKLARQTYSLLFHLFSSWSEPHIMRQLARQTKGAFTQQIFPSDFWVIFFFYI